MFHQIPAHAVEVGDVIQVAEGTCAGFTVRIKGIRRLLGGECITFVFERNGRDEAITAYLDAPIWVEYNGVLERPVPEQSVSDTCSVDATGHPSCTSRLPVRRTIHY